ncbi:MAG: ImmA/IrrE family metallo-endopeptidase [Desulfovibrio sp.]|nr:ImmA/IrrE family metallo-endopeptidase [Desulfovibrio sp.]
MSREGGEEIKLVGSISTDMEIFEAAGIIRKKLNMPSRDRYKKENEYFKAIREHIHPLGIYVILMGDVGDYHSKIFPDEFRGLALADKFVPMIAVNKYDAKADNVFTLLHEFVHIFLGNSGITNNPVFKNDSNSKIENFCNAVAAEILEGLFSAL